MEISCVIPAFENLDLFARCLASVVAQKGADLEIIVRTAVTLLTGRGVR